jgi:hypothetical protein
VTNYCACYLMYSRNYEQYPRANSSTMARIANHMPAGILVPTEGFAVSVKILEYFKAVLNAGSFVTLSRYFLLSLLISRCEDTILMLLFRFSFLLCILPNVVVEWLTFCFVFRRSRVQISAWRPSVLTEGFRRCPQPVKTLP